MHLFLCSVDEELEPYKAAAGEVARSLGYEPIEREPIERGPAERGPAELPGLDPVAACTRQVVRAERVLAIVGRRCGAVPSPEDGGDGLRPWAFWEVRSAFAHRKPVAVLMTGEGWPAELGDATSGDAAIDDLRGELGRLAMRFDPEAEDSGLPAFRDRVRHQLGAVSEGAAPADRVATDRHRPGLSRGLELRRWPPPELPERPYPVLLPYTHPRLLAGRQRELGELHERLRAAVPILGLYAASGTGKSSLLRGGLVPSLRAAGRPVAYDRRPAEVGLAGRLLRDLLVADNEATLAIGDDEAERFVERLLAVRQLAGERAGESGSDAAATPVLVIDQFEDLFRPAARRARAALGVLLAMSVQRQRGLGGSLCLGGPLCHWIMACRQEFHGELFLWLGDVLRDAHAEGLAVSAELPRDLSVPDRFADWPLAPLGTPEPGARVFGAEEVTVAAARIFRDAIETPLRLRGEDGDPRYPWRFAAPDAERLARVFGAARARRPEAPLVPELQVVLAHLLDAAPPPEDGASSEDAVAEVTVPEDPGELIDRALEEHLRAALETAFPAGSGRQTRIARTRALLALRELADAEGRRDDGVAAEPLARAIGEEGRDVLAKLATPRTRIVVPFRRGEELGYVLAHDRLAEVLVRLVDGGHYAALGVDRELLELRRFVELESGLFAAGESGQTTRVPERHFKRIEAHAEALLWGQERQRWWTACKERRRVERRQARVRRALGSVVLIAVALLTWYQVDQRKKLDALFEEVAQGDPEPAFAAVEALVSEWERQPEEVRARLREREWPLDVLERGIGGITGEVREAAVLQVAEVALPLIVEDAPEDPVRIAGLVWALDFFAPKGERTRELRDLALAPLRAQRPPPPLPDAGDPLWAEIPAGTFLMGAAPDEGRDDPNMADEKPRHRVTLSAFRMGIYEVTNAEFRRLYPEHAEGQGDRLPAARMTWHEAYTYAAWLGGRLPTEAEAEYVRRGGCDFAYCKRDGSEATLSAVAWWLGNSADPEGGDPATRPVGGREPNPWGLFDLYGNVWELCAEWYGGPYSAADQANPPGATNTTTDYRIARGGSAWEPAEWVVASGRSALTFGLRSRAFGLRILLPVAEP